MIWTRIKKNIQMKFQSLQYFFFIKFLVSETSTPNFIQIEAAECGSTALSIILGYYKKYVSAEEVRIKCGVSRNGSKAANILKAAREYGMIARGAQLENILELDKDAFPLIAFWEFNHFVVIEKITQAHVHVNDPAQGPLILSRTSFDKSFTGVVLLLKPGPEFKKEGKNPLTLPPIKPLLLKYKIGVIFLIIISLAALIPAMIIPATSKIFIDDIMIKQLMEWFRPLILLMLMMGFITLLINWIQQSFLLRLNLRLTSWLATRFVWHLLNLPLSFFASRFSGDILMRVKSISNLSQLISSGLSSALSSLITAIFFVIIMFILSIKLTIVVLMMTILGLFVSWYHKYYLKIKNQLMINSYSQLTGVEIGGIQSIEFIKASGSNYEFLNKRSGLFSKNIKNRQDLAGYEMSLDFSNQLITGLNSIMVIGVGSLMIIDGQLSIGTLIAFQVLSGGVVGPLVTLSNLTARIQEGKANLVRLRDAFNHPQAAETSLSQRDYNSPLKGDVEIKNVSFSYSPMDAAILSNVNLRIPEGSTCAIIGKSGSGKSTLALLIAGLYPPSSGKISIGGFPLEHMDQGIRGKTIGLIDSDLGIFEGSLQDNISLFESNISFQSLFEAIQKSHLEEVVDQIGGLQGIIMENGTNISGGQRQRIEIARLLYQNPKILILDEATSALDTLLESKIYQNLKGMGYTLIIISHRLGSIQESDQIIVLDKGEIIDQGKHEDLMRNSSHYKQLVSSE